MNWDREKPTLDLKEQVEKKVNIESIHSFENPVEELILGKFQRYKTIFNCRYSSIKE